MKVTIITIGKTKKKFLKIAIKDYSKRISRYSKVKNIILKPEFLGNNLSKKDIKKIKDKEGKKILSKINNRDYIFALDRLGKSLNSLDFSKKIKRLRVTGKSNITFIIGGSYGLSKEVLKRANMKLSFSKMTFPHQLMKVILLEQIYR
ncbi:MAG: 23S rRNA (pseudouridine(1915)-N(3))-methyltransferase RlmH, partial [Bacillota bacterium]